MTAARTIALFKNDIARTVEDGLRKMTALYGDETQEARTMVIKSVDERVRAIWGVSLADLEG